MKKLLKYSILTISIAIIAVLLINHVVKAAGSKYIMDVEEVPEVDAILVLGAYVHPSGTVSQILEDRLLTSLDVYHQGKADKILVSGDHGTIEYDEVNAMKQFLLDKGLKSKDVFMDHAGFNTYESMYRAKDIFEIEKVIIVTQEYHLMRAVFLARELGIEAYGVASDRRVYWGMPKFLLREVLARNKDFLIAKIKPEPTYLGEVIPINSDGRLTDDK